MLAPALFVWYLVQLKIWSFACEKTPLVDLDLVYSHRQYG